MKKIVLSLLAETKTFWATAIGKIVIIGTSCVMIGATATGIGVGVGNKWISSKSIIITQSKVIPSTKTIPWKNLTPSLPLKGNLKINDGWLLTEPTYRGWNIGYHLLSEAISYDLYLVNQFNDNKKSFKSLFSKGGVPYNGTRVYVNSTHKTTPNIMLSNHDLFSKITIRSHINIIVRSYINEILVTKDNLKKINDKVFCALKPIRSRLGKDEQIEITNINYSFQIILREHQWVYCSCTYMHYSIKLDSFDYLIKKL